jgi:flagellar biosynthesis protein FlhB
LEKEVARIDAAARRGLSAQQQERLKMRRKDVKDEMWGLECGS